MAKYENGQRVQVRNSHSGHWVYGEVIATEPEGIAVRYGKANKQELVKESRVRNPIPKKTAAKKGKKMTVAANTNTARSFVSSAQNVVEEVHPTAPAQTAQEAPQEAPRTIPARPVPTPKERAEAILKSVDAALDAAKIKREAMDNEIGALANRRRELETYIKLDAEFNR